MILLLHNYDLIVAAVEHILDEAVTTFSSVEDAVKSIQTGEYDCAIVEPLQFPDAVRVLSPHVHVVVLTSNGGHDGVLRAIKDGASGYLHASCQFDEFLNAIESARKGVPR